MARVHSARAALAALSLATLGGAINCSSALAEQRIIYGNGAGGDTPSLVTSTPVNVYADDHQRIITRPVVYPNAVVRRDLAEQPVWPHMIEVQVNTITTWIDPQVDYEHKGRGQTLDRDHWIVKAQREADPVVGPRIIYGSEKAMKGDVPIAAREPLIVSAPSKPATADKATPDQSSKPTTADAKKPTPVVAAGKPAEKASDKTPSKTDAHTPANPDAIPRVPAPPAKKTVQLVDASE